MLKQNLEYLQSDRSCCRCASLILASLDLTSPHLTLFSFSRPHSRQSSIKSLQLPSRLNAACLYATSSSEQRESYFPLIDSRLAAFLLRLPSTCSTGISGLNSERQHSRSPTCASEITCCGARSISPLCIILASACLISWDPSRPSASSLLHLICPSSQHLLQVYPPINIAPRLLGLPLPDSPPRLLPGRPGAEDHFVAATGLPVTTPSAASPLSPRRRRIRSRPLASARPKTYSRRLRASFSPAPSRSSSSTRSGNTSHASSFERAFSSEPSSDAPVASASKALYSSPDIAASGSSFAAASISTLEGRTLKSSLRKSFLQPNSTDAKVSKPRTVDSGETVPSSAQSSAQSIGQASAASPSGKVAGSTPSGRSRASSGAQSTASTAPAAVNAARAALGHLGHPSRPASPAKRTRAEMETADDPGPPAAGSQPAEKEPEDVYMKSDPATDSSEQDLPVNKKVSRVAQVAPARNARENSVDMLADERAAATSNLPSTLTGASQQRSRKSSSSEGLHSRAKSASSSPTENTNNEPDPATQEQPPSLIDQIAIITRLMQSPIYDNMKGFIISHEWLAEAQSRGTNYMRSSKEARAEAPIPPVDIRNLLDGHYLTTQQLYDDQGERFYPLRPGLEVERDIEVIPADAWNKIVAWHGVAPESPPVIRFCHNTSDTPTRVNNQFELYPPILTLVKIPDTSASDFSSPDSQRLHAGPPVKMVVSRHSLFADLLSRAKELIGISTSTHVRVWRIMSSLADASSRDVGMLTPAQSRSNSPAPFASGYVDPGSRLVIDPHTLVSLQEGTQRELIDVQAENTIGAAERPTVRYAGIGQDSVLVLEERIMGPAGGEWVSDAARVSLLKQGLGTKNLSSSTTLRPKSANASGRSSPVPSGMMTRGRTQRSGRLRGAIGLGNLGNTCYMNSALQCLRAVEELTVYFLHNRYLKELNPSNVLSYKGEVAKSYASLLKEIYSSSSSSVSPRSFKSTIGRWGSQFSGYGQQDSQEFLLFLLDGLQEDLNRIDKKPYIEKPDSTDEMLHDQVALRKLADRSWEIYKMRNDSVITDLFAGMYKSTVVCPVCAKVSIIFDPFNNLTLQLPLENLWSHTVRFYPARGAPVQIQVDLDSSATFGQLKEFVSTRTNTDVQRLVLAETYNHKFYQMFQDRGMLGESNLKKGDVVVLYELDEIPTNYPHKPKKQNKIHSMLDIHDDEEPEVPDGDVPESERIVVPVFHRVPSSASSTRASRNLEFVAEPSYIVLDREAARDTNEILRKVLGRVDNMTTLDLFDDDEEASDASESDDVVMMTADDATSSNEENKVQAASIPSDEGFVDVSMQDGNDSGDSPRISYPPQVAKKSRSLPRGLRSGAPISPDLRDMFDISVVHTREWIPTGWHSFPEDNKRFTRLDDLAAERRRSHASKLRQRGGAGSGAQLKRRIANGGSDSSSEDELSRSVPAADHAMHGIPTADDDSSTEEEATVPVQRNGFGKFHRKTLRNSQGLITHGAVGARRGSRFLPRADSPITLDQPALVGLGDALILDWTPTAFDRLFGGNTRRTHMHDDDESTGVSTSDNMALLPDHELELKRRLRNERRRNGVTLDDCLDEFGREEILSEEDAWYCPRCKKHQRASKKFELWKVPDILVVHLKRFSTQGRFRDKIDLQVQFPVDGLDLNERVAVHEDGKELIYDLFAVDNHYGGLGGGHYTAYAKVFPDGQWYGFDDAQATPRSNPESVVTPAAYMLFYRRRSSTPLGGSSFDDLFVRQDVLDTDGDSASRSTSTHPRPESQSGEGRRLDDSSRNGSSSALDGAAAIHQTGGGGFGPAARPAPATLRARSDAAGTVSRGAGHTEADDDNDTDLPAYSDAVADSSATPFESMETDDPPAAAQSSQSYSLSHAQAATWAFGSVKADDSVHNEADSSKPDTDATLPDLGHGVATRHSSVSSTGAAADSEGPDLGSDDDDATLDDEGASGQPPITLGDDEDDEEEEDNISDSRVRAVSSISRRRARALVIADRDSDHGRAGFVEEDEEEEEVAEIKLGDESD